MVEENLEQILTEEYKKVLSLFLKGSSANKIFELNPEEALQAYETLRRAGLLKGEYTSEEYRFAEAYRGLLTLIPRKNTVIKRTLGLSPDNLLQSYVALRKIGLDNEMIVKNSGLLAKESKQLLRRYQKLRELGIGREDILKYLSLLRVDDEIIDGNVYLLSRIGIDYTTKPGLLVRNYHLKRRNLAVVLEGFFNYSTIPIEKRKQAREQFHKYLRDNTQILNYPEGSLRTIIGTNDPLVERAKEYKLE